MQPADTRPLGDTIEASVTAASFWTMNNIQSRPITALHCITVLITGKNKSYYKVLSTTTGFYSLSNHLRSLTSAWTLHHCHLRPHRPLQHGTIVHERPGSKSSCYCRHKQGCWSFLITLEQHVWGWRGNVNHLFYLEADSQVLLTVSSANSRLQHTGTTHLILERFSVVAWKCSLVLIINHSVQLTN